MLHSYRTFIMLISAIFIVLFFAYPQYKQAQALNEGVTAYEDLLTKIEAYNSKLESLVSHFKKLPTEEKEHVYTIAGADPLDPSQIFYNLEQMARSSGLIVQSTQLAKEVSAQRSSMDATQRLDFLDFTSLDVSVGVFGTYNGIKKFIDTIETSAEPYQVAKIEFDNKTGGAIFSATIQVRVYHLSE